MVVYTVIGAFVTGAVLLPAMLWLCRGGMKDLRAMNRSGERRQTPRD